MKARSGRREDYRNELQLFIDKHPKGPHHDYAQALIDKYEGRMPKKQGADVEEVAPPIPTNEEHHQPEHEYLPMQPDISHPAIPEEIQKLIDEQKRKIKSNGAPVPPSDAPDQLQEPRKGF
jgi:hypothetical protein